jgi:hypothetical protein
MTVRREFCDRAKRHRVRKRVKYVARICENRKSDSILQVSDESEDADGEAKPVGYGRR